MPIYMSMQEKTDAPNTPKRSYDGAQTRRSTNRRPLQYFAKRLVILQLSSPAPTVIIPVRVSYDMSRSQNDLKEPVLEGECNSAWWHGSWCTVSLTT